jgi:hypothetical protein
MKTFDQFLSEKSNDAVISSITRKLFEAGINPVRYVQLRLAENMAPAMAAAPPGQAARPAGNMAGDPNQDIGQMKTMVAQIIQKYGKTHPEMTKIATNMQKEVEGLTAANQKDSQAMQQGQMPQQPQQQAPGVKPLPGQPQQGQPQPMMGQPPVR